MKKLYSFILLSTIFVSLTAQDINISFQPAVSGTNIDSIWVTNQRTNEKVKLLGNESLTLTKVTSANDIPFTSDERFIFPNPCNGYAEVSFATSLNQEVKVNVNNISGQLLSTKSQFLMPGQHRFKISFPENGIYNVSVLKGDGSINYKVVCLKPEESKCIIKYTGTEHRNQTKSVVVGKALNYVQGDILNCSAYSAKNNTIISDSPTASKSYSVEFYECKDADNNFYPIVKIGQQWWMAENLKTTKYKDGTSILNITSESGWYGLRTSAAYCWLYDNIKYKSTHGALYNWNAVNTGKLCPAGWHVPSYYEWNTLTNYLINNGYGYGDSGWDNDIAKALAAKTNWGYSDSPGAPGNDPASNNSSGFSGLPCGHRDYKGEFYSNGKNGYWWSSTEYHPDEAWSQALRYNTRSFRQESENKRYGSSVRCLRDSN
jgi:uncharacterized protein (TIGR02145 family)